ncbi:flavin reductase family protein [Rhodobacteraceae bacterium KMM 6894]|nr:flavin reductase family protein [Rhodobacteraceae bacterium KMM 6894]
MFYKPENGHGLPHNPLNAIVSPRPIGWISTVSLAGVRNVAPYSLFNAVAYVPPQVMFASNGNKDSVRNIRDTGVFCANVVSQDMRDVMNKTSGAVPEDVDEFALAGLTALACTSIDCPRIQGVPASLECQMTQIITLRGTDNFAIFGEVTGVHIRDDCLKDGLFDVTTFQPLSRLGYRDFAVVENVFTLTRPDD